jgi:hypothetical protein
MLLGDSFEEAAANLGNLADLSTAHNASLLSSANVFSESGEAQALAMDAEVRTSLSNPKSDPSHGRRGPHLSVQP